MSRPLRIHYQNAWYHVMNRGAGHQKIFKTKTHRMMFLKLLEESHQMFNVKICAYCLMDNHYHLLISTPDANLSRVMRHINGVYTQKYNQSLNTDGALFRGRYKSQLIEDDCYQLIVSRYIHLNPVEAGLVDNPADYKWSSYAAYLGMVSAPDWLSADIIIKQLSETKSLAHVKNYKDYVEEKSMEEINVFNSIKNTAPVIGSELFKASIISQVSNCPSDAYSPDVKRIRKIPDIELVIRHVCAFYGVSYESLRISKRASLNWPRHVYMYLCRKKYGYSLRAIAESLGVLRPEAVGHEIRKCHLRLSVQYELVCEISNIYELIHEAMKGEGKSPLL